MKRLLLYIFLSLLAVDPVHAHKPSDSYLSLDVQERGGSPRIQGQWDIALRDLDFAIGLDGDDDGMITWGELRARHAAVAAYVLPRLSVKVDRTPCAIQPTEHLVDYHTDGAYSVLRFAVDCPMRPRILELRYALFFDLDPQHKGLLRLEYQGLPRTAIFSHDQPIQRFELATLQPWRQLFAFGREGVWHIWIGFDHILFLLSLLLPAVLHRVAGRWQAISHFRPAFWEVFKIVTAFTLAHSITLSLATLSIVQLPSRWVESAIAASVVLAASNNIYPLFQGRRWIVAFAFGLIHGFGFASVLMDLGLPQGALLLSLVGFNLGVEVGQLAIVSTFLILAYGIRGSWFYQRLILVPGSLLIVTVATVWLLERIFNLRLLPI